MTSKLCSFRLEVVHTALGMHHLCYLIFFNFGAVSYV